MSQSITISSDENAEIVGVRNYPNAASLVEQNLYHRYSKRILKGPVEIFEYDQKIQRAQIIKSRTYSIYNPLPPAGEYAIGSSGDVFEGNFEFGVFAVAVQGKLHNADILYRALIRRGCIFRSRSPSEIVGHLVAISLYSTILDRIFDATSQLIGGVCLIALHNESLFGARLPEYSEPLYCWRGTPLHSNSCMISTNNSAVDFHAFSKLVTLEPNSVVSIDNSGFNIYTIPYRNRNKNPTVILQTEAEPSISTTPPELPASNVGVHFELNEEGIIGLVSPASLDKQGNNISLLRKLHPSIRAVGSDFVVSLSRGNIPHKHLFERASAYFSVLDHDLGCVDGIAAMRILWIPARTFS